MKATGVMAFVAALLMLGSAAAQESPLECELFGGCPDSGNGDTSNDSSTDTDEDEADEEVVEETVPQSGGLALPEAASDQGVASSAKGIATANQVREDGRGLGQSRAGK